MSICKNVALSILLFPAIFKKPFVAALEISASNFRKFSLVVSFLPEDIVDSKFLIPVLILESLNLLISARLRFCKILFFADLIFGKQSSWHGKSPLFHVFLVMSMILNSFSAYEVLM